VNIKQQIFAVVATSVLLVLIGVLIKRRKLREEYALLWLITGIGIMVLVIGYPLLVWISQLIGAVAPTTTLFLFAFLFIILISISFSVRFSKLSDQMQSVITEMSFLRKELEDLKNKTQPGPG
jgi:hypothetical protein